MVRMIVYISDVQNRRISVLFTSPESIVEGKWHTTLKSAHYRKHLALVTCDEVHCVPKW